MNKDKNKMNKELLENIEKYTLNIKILHWLMAFMVLGIILSGWYMAGLPQDASYKYDIYSWHKSFGVLFFILIVIRVLMRAFGKSVALPKFMSLSYRLAIKIVHFALYFFMISIPITGFLMSTGSGRITPFFFVNIPPLFSLNSEWIDFLHKIHTEYPYIMLFIIVLHLLGVLKNRFFASSMHEKKLFNRMW